MVTDDTKNVESLSIELISKNFKNAVLSTNCRPPDGDFKAFNNFLKDLYSVTLKPNKFFYATRGPNLLKRSSLQKNEKVTKFLILNLFSIVFARHKIS